MWDDAALAELRAYVRAGYTTAEIAERMGRSYWSVAKKRARAARETQEEREARLARLIEPDTFIAFHDKSV